MAWFHGYSSFYNIQACSVNPSALCERDLQRLRPSRVPAPTEIQTRPCQTTSEQVAHRSNPETQSTGDVLFSVLHPGVQRSGVSWLRVMTLHSRRERGVWWQRTFPDIDSRAVSLLDCVKPEYMQQPCTRFRTQARSRESLFL